MAMGTIWAMRALSVWLTLALFQRAFGGGFVVD
jgi:hypothetical protein